MAPSEGKLNDEMSSVTEQSRLKEEDLNPILAV